MMATPFLGGPVAANHNDDHRVDYEVVIVFYDAIPTTIDVEVAEYGGVVVERSDFLDFVTVNVPPLEANAMIDDFNARDDVEAAYHNLYLFAQTHGDAFTPNDPHFPDQAYHQLINSEPAWEISLNNILGIGSMDVSIAIMDTGIENHDDLDPNRFDDTCPSGGTFTTASGGTRDHGTRVAGFAAARIHNSAGVSGVTNSCIVNYKVLGGAQGDEVGDPDMDHGTAWGTHTDLALALLDAAEQGIDIASMSIGSTQSDIVLEQAILHADRSGMLLVAAAGNFNKPCTSSCYPADYSEVMDVAAANNATDMWDGSLAGEVAAPGGAASFTTDVDGGYSEPFLAPATSWATPMVSGLAALIDSNAGVVGDNEPGDLTGTDLRCIIQNSAEDIPGEFSDGYGMVNASKAIHDIGRLGCV